MSAQEQKLYALTGLFEKPEEILHAADTARKRYRKFDAHTPYPLHGLDDAMGLGESGMGWLTLIIGTTCMLLMLSFIAWVSLVDYPNVWAGKPYFSLPGYIPILFEVLVLTGAVGTVLILFLIVSGFPRNNHPLHDTAYMQRTSDDMFGLCIEAADERFEEVSAREMLENLGAKTIIPVYYDVKEARSGLSLANPLFLGFAVVVAITVSGAGYFGLNRMVFMPPFNWMSVQPRAVAQETKMVFKDQRSMQQPVDYTIPRGYLPETFGKDQADEMGKYLVNPLPQSQEIFELGKEKYESRCSVCHGYYAQGDGRLPADVGLNGLSLHSPKVAEQWTDGRIYHVMTYGQNLMPGYAKQLTRDERWAVIHYIRALQRSLNPKESDMQ